MPDNPAAFFTYTPPPYMFRSIFLLVTCLNLRLFPGSPTSLLVQANRTFLLTKSPHLRILLNEGANTKLCPILRGGSAMLVTATEFKSNIGRYLSLVASEDIFITKNGKSVAKLSSTKQDKVELAKSLFGIAKGCTMTLEQAREERLARYETAD
jgi:antitoxin (DNA-binding transcriptional repressor) of toxin-antitoxin stability system